jgi:hypothetical protein
MLDYPLADVIDLMRHHMDRNRRTQLQEIPTAQQAAPAPIPRSSGQRVIYRKATDNDDWW